MSRNGSSQSPSTYRQLFITIGIISALVFLWARTSFNHYQVDLFDLEGINLQPIQATELLSEKGDGLLSMRCRLPQISSSFNCGVQVHLPKDAQGNLFSFDKIDRMEIATQVLTAPERFDGRLQVNIVSMFKGGGDQTLTDSNLKFHSTRIGSGTFEIPLDRFDVASWWQDAYNISFEDAKKDFSQVESVYILLNDRPLKYQGEYQFTVSELKVDGYLVDPLSLNNWLLTFWLMLGVGSLLHFSWRGHGTLQRMRRVALYDHATELLNEQGLRDYLRGLAPEADGALYILRFDNAAILERHFGEKVFNQLLIKTKQRLLSVFQSQSVTLVRLSEAEFALFCPTGILAREQLLERIFKEGVEMEGVGHLKLDVIASVVVESSIPKKLDAVLEKGRFVLDQPKDRTVFAKRYTSELDEPLQRKASVEQAVRRCIAEDDFYLVFMPLYDARRDRVMGAEALLRSNSESLRQLSQEVYIPVAEKANLIQEIDMLVLRKALAAIKQHELPEGFVLSINISAQELLDSEFAQRIDAALRSAGVLASSICLEVTETFFVHMDEAKVEVLDQLRALGCLVSLDDFGTGYTSFAHLQRLSVDEIKIDRSFVSRLNDPKARVVVESMVNIAQALDYKLVAEGVETLEQLDYLRSLGCHCFQGFLFSEPTTLKKALAARKPATVEISLR
ncbi:EAL domain-containing protein [Marinomonas gallaica]|uniref:EAL domain-containing protein n=1 Tax=Marinomonas gallaica TaxID=1806667 RepID=UPI003A907740